MFFTLHDLQDKHADERRFAPYARDDTDALDTPLEVLNLFAIDVPLVVPAIVKRAVIIDRVVGLFRIELRGNSFDATCRLRTLSSENHDDTAGSEAQSLAVWRNNEFQGCQVKARGASLTIIYPVPKQQKRDDGSSGPC